MLIIRVMLVDCFSTLTPWRLTSSGSTGVRLVDPVLDKHRGHVDIGTPTSKVTVILHEPSAADFEDM